MKVQYLKYPFILYAIVVIFFKKNLFIFSKVREFITILFENNF
jgi:hypothetical protein